MRGGLWVCAPSRRFRQRKAQVRASIFSARTCRGKRFLELATTPPASKRRSCPAHQKTNNQHPGVRTYTTNSSETVHTYPARLHREVDGHTPSDGSPARSVRAMLQETEPTRCARLVACVGSKTGGGIGGELGKETVGETIRQSQHNATFHALQLRLLLLSPSRRKSTNRLLCRRSACLADTTTLLRISASKGKKKRITTHRSN
jgi:hypothetical protein